MGLRASWEGIDPGFRRLMGLFRDDIVRLVFDLDDHLETVAALMPKYHDTPMSLADACLVRMSELHINCRIFTLDSDFKLCRPPRPTGDSLDLPGLICAVSAPISATSGLTADC